ncbi:MAG: D-ribose transporter ATP-binding protein [Peptococcaceae bacterium BRH_c23]|nr:MAG: D-ribose transporter ATP-binding protein [Peptococcaceae bacterium BRH_c23]KJS82858.1 MAG: D-ribose transporter ATP-binding protein [Desulfosporosinus sp. BICA1-9]
MENITKVYPGAVALENVTFEVAKGEVRALCGENGAGKSTLMKIFAGAIQKTSGKLFINDQEVTIDNPHVAKGFGISIIYQEFFLNPNLSIAENIYLGREPMIKSLGIINWKKIYSDAEEICDRLHFKINVKTLVKKLSVAQMQMVEIAKAISWNASIIIMDEPTATLTNTEIDSLFDVIKELKKHEVTIVYISHRLEEIFRIADSVTVLRDGKTIGTELTKSIDKSYLIKMMVGRELIELARVERCRKELTLEVKNLNQTGILYDINLKAYKGEILGISGLVGSGRTELVRAIFGADPISSGEIFIEGKKVNIRNIRDAIRAGIGLVSEDRKRQGLVLGLEIYKNITLVSLKEVLRRLMLFKKYEEDVARKYMSNLKIKTPSASQKVINLSGGNQQKVVLAKWMFTNPKVLIFDEPTRGIDVGAKFEIYNLMNQLVADGITIIVISSELPEILGISDRILIMNEGHVAGELSREEATQEKILHYAAGVMKEK